MKFLYNWLKEFEPSLPLPKKTANLLTMHAFEVGEAYRDQGDWVLDVDVLPNRMPDASSHEGIARELGTILAVQGNKRVGFRAVQPKIRETQGYRAASVLSVSIEDRQGCSFYASRVVGGIRVLPSPSWLQKRLRAAGLEPINNIVDATNYVMLELGQPLHAFDFDRIAEQRRAERGTTQKLIMIRRAKQGEKITTLDGETRELPPFATLIADSQKPLAIAGIKGGSATAISSKTKSIVLEAALFAASRIYQTSRALGLATDASRRFEAGRPSTDVIRALDRAAQLIAQIAGGKVAAGRVVAGKAIGVSRSIPFSREYAGKLLGMDISERQARKVFDALRCRIVARKGQWAVTPPPHRLDLENEEDLIEEAGRLVGYENIPARSLHAPMGLIEVPSAHQWAERVRDILAGAGFSETMRLSFVNRDLLTQWGFSASGLVELENPQSGDATLLRSTLLARLLALAQEAQRSGASANLFEIGDVFSQSKGERQMLGLVHAAAGEKKPFYMMKGIVQDLCDRCGLSEISWVPSRETARPYHPGRSADIFIDGKKLGTVGELHPRIAQKQEGLDGVAIAELDLDLFAGLASEEHKYRSPSKYPEVVRDLAVLVPYDTLADFVEQEIVRVGKALLRDVDVLDEHFDDRFPEGMKSLAFRLFYQSNTKTLTSQEVDVLHKKIEVALRARGWEVR